MVSDPRSPVKLVLSDMDGTILTPEKTLSPATLRAVERLKQAKIPLALVSARPPEGMLPYIKQLQLTDACAGFNGGLIFTPEGSVRSNHIFPAYIVEKLLAKLDFHEVEIWFQNEDGWSVRDAETELVRRERNVIGVTPQPVPDLWALTAKVNRIIATGPDAALVERLEVELGREFSGQASVLRSTPIKLNITPALATKGHALKELASFYGITPHEVACLGDAPNDLPMLREAGVGIAMGQAAETVRAEATYITESNEKDGWAEAIETFIMPRVLHS